MPLGDVVALDRRQCDFSRPELLPSLVRGIKPDVIVNAAAYTAVDKAEREEKLASTINGTAVGVIAEEARKAGIGWRLLICVVHFDLALRKLLPEF